MRFSRFGIRFQVVNAVVRRSGSTLHWSHRVAVGHRRRGTRVRPVTVQPVFEAHDFRRARPLLPIRPGRDVQGASVLRTISTYHRYAFGPG